MLRLNRRLRPALLAPLLVATAATAQPVPNLPLAPAPPADAGLARPAIGPEPGWAAIVPLPPPPPESAEAAISVLLSDQQVRLTPQGLEQFSHGAYRIGSAQALQAASIALTWDPALETLTLHRIRLIRDGKPIDLLQDGKGLTVVRRDRARLAAGARGRSHPHRLGRA
jgi:hypothetical protein